MGSHIPLTDEELNAMDDMSPWNFKQLRLGYRTLRMEHLRLAAELDLNRKALATAATHAGELGRAREEIERMRPVYEAAVAWRPHFKLCDELIDCGIPPCDCEDCKLARPIDAALSPAKGDGNG